MSGVGDKGRKENHVEEAGDGLRRKGKNGLGKGDFFVEKEGGEKDEPGEEGNGSGDNGRKAVGFSFKENNVGYPGKVGKKDKEVAAY